MISTYQSIAFDSMETVTHRWGVIAINQKVKTSTEHKLHTARKSDTPRKQIATATSHGNNPKESNL